MIRIAASLALAAAPLPLQARPAEELGCIEKIFDEETVLAIATLGGFDRTAAGKAAATINFPFIVAGVRQCAQAGGWSANEAANGAAYMMGWPTMAGLWLRNEKHGYAALDRAYVAHAGDFADKPRPSGEAVEALLAYALADGLRLPPGEAALHDARRYIDVLWQLDVMRADFAAGRKPSAEGE
jgi:hypothetical protein